MNKFLTKGAVSLNIKDEVIKLSFKFYVWEEASLWTH